MPNPTLQTTHILVERNCLRVPVLYGLRMRSTNLIKFNLIPVSTSEKLVPGLHVMYAPIYRGDTDGDAPAPPRARHRPAAVLFNAALLTRSSRTRSSTSTSWPSPSLPLGVLGRLHTASSRSSLRRHTTMTSTHGQGRVQNPMRTSLWVSL